MKRVLVTGGSGFIGGRLISELRRRGVEVVALARSEASSAKVAALGATAAKGELDDEASIRAAAGGCDTVFHAAAHTDQFDPLEVHLRITVQGTKNVLAASRAAGVKRFVHVGTEAVLADGRPIVRATEERPRAAVPMGAYPLAKGLAEEAVLGANAPEFETVVIRPRFVWGKGDTSLLPEFVAAVKSGGFAWISQGRYLTSTTHVANVVEALILGAEKATPGECYFVTDGAPVEFRDFVTRLLATQGLDAGTRSIPRWLARLTVGATQWMKRPPLTRTAFSLMAHEVTVDDAKARRELGYRGAVSLEAGLAELGGKGPIEPDDSER